jgi:hypothetical protein
MDRLHHLRQTLPVNITDNENYENLEFILLDYNSSDALEEYVKTNLSIYIETGKLIYCKTFTPKFFHRSHSRNLAFKLATGDLICNIDADNFTGKNFANYINESFEKEENIFLTTLGDTNRKYQKDTLGRICVKREDFYNIKGYDERMVSYGFEDYDFANRLELSGVKRSLICKEENLQAINHEQKERISNEFMLKNLNSLSLNYRTPSSTEFLFLFNDGKFKKGIIIDNKFFEYKARRTTVIEIQENYKFSICDDAWEEGTWKRTGDLINLFQNGIEIESFNFNKSNDCIISLSKPNYNFYKVSDTLLIHQGVMLFSQITNRLIMNRNKLHGSIIVNENGYGTDTIYRNFHNKAIKID